MGGLEIIRAVQLISSPFLDGFFEFMTNLHHIDFYILTFPLLLWLYDKRFTRYLISVFLVGYATNGFLKHFFDTLRPPADQVRKVFEYTATGPAMPSGHAQNPLMFWGAIALQVNRRWVTVVLAVVVFLIGLSRIYGGLHWPIDILVGWAIGAVMLFLFEYTRPFWVGTHMRLATKLMAATAIPLVTIALHQATPWNTPADLAGDAWTAGGAYLGFWFGSLLEEEWVGFDPRRGTWLTHALKLVLGVAAVLGVRVVLKSLFPPIAIGDFFRYIVVGLMVSLIMPWVFSRFLTPGSVHRQAPRSHNF